VNRARVVFIEKSPSGWVQLFRYVVVAAIGLIFDFGGLILLTESLHVFYLVSATISFVVALVINYVLSTLWVFPQSKYSRWHEFLFFGLIGIVGLGLNDLLIWVLSSGFGIYYIVSKMIATCTVFAWNFLARKFLLY
jgi:putative flippase GtrA